MDNTFFSIVFRQKYIERWGLMRNTTPESLSEHAYEVAVIAHAIAEIGNTIFGRSYDSSAIAVKALFHDAAEVYTGDLPTPVKYFDETIRSDYARLEDNAVNTLLSKLPTELQEIYSSFFRYDNDEEKTIVKAADKLCAYIKCVEELKSGNSEFKCAAESTRSLLNKYSLPELDYFIENILPTFSLSLDEM